MPVIIDTNCLANVFSRTSTKHQEFKPVLDWILNGNGIMVYGGTKYLEELKKAKKYAAIINYLKDVKKVHIGDKENIDRIQSQIEAQNHDSDFDDPHLPAIAIETKCKIICSEDRRSIKFVTNKQFYPKNFTPPVYFTNHKNKDLLCDAYIDDRLRSNRKLNIEQSKRITSIFGSING